MKSVTVSTVSSSISHEVMGPDTMILVFKFICKMKAEDFPSGPVKNPSASAGDTGSIPDLGRFHMPWVN